MDNAIECDAFVVGAGLGGIYQTIKLRELRLETICVDKAPGVGGTWYWNRYPGAMSDTESYLYRYSFDKEDLRTYPWQTRYLYQPEILKYIKHIVEKHHIQSCMHLGTEMKSATWLETENRWRIECSGAAAGIYRARYLLNALGILTNPNLPDIKGLHNFHGDIIHTAAWPDNLDLAAKRVGVIGNGSTGIQVMTALAPKVKQLVSFQRSPQYSVPSGQQIIDNTHREWINNNYDTIYKDVWSSINGFGIPEVSRPCMSVSAEERREIFQDCWEKGGGFRFMFSGFGDLATSVESNKEACKFIHSKIDEIVTDSTKAEALKPTELYARRPLCDTGYYQIFNRDNVDIVNLQKNPIDEIVPTGIRLADGNLIALDCIVMATGFDAIEGSYKQVSITGQNGYTLSKHWETGGSSYLGVACANFPNMFLIAGPLGPFANFPTAIESEVNFITKCIAHTEAQAARNLSSARVVVSGKAEEAWLAHCDELTQGSIFRSTKSWIFGQNVEGKPSKVKFYFGGLAKYLAKTNAEADEGFPSFNTGDSQVEKSANRVAPCISNYVGLGAVDVRSKIQV